MTNEEFEALVARLDPIAKQHPARYEFRVVLLALLGYAYIALMLLLLLGVIVGSFWIMARSAAIGAKLLLVVVPFVWLVFRAMAVKIPAPDGVEITAKYSPALFEMIESLRHRLRAPHFHRVLITSDFNAGVQQVPRLGPLGWYRNYLLIGLPLMKAFTAPQLEAVLAHELGHLARGHGAIANRLYTLRMRWVQLLEALTAKESAGAFLFVPFFKWYSPYFNAYSFPLARLNEYQADATSVKLCGKDNVAQALTGSTVVGMYLEEKYWPDIHKQADTSPQPAFAPYREMGSASFLDGARDIVPATIESALRQKTGIANTHPALQDRLAAIGMQANFAPPAPGAAADTLLGDATGRIAELYDDKWLKTIAPSWGQRYEAVVKGRETLAANMKREADGEVLPVEAAFEHALMLEDMGNDKDAAFACLQALHMRAPDHVPTMYHLGQRMLMRDDDAGIALLEQCIQKEADAFLPCCEMLFHYAKKQGREQDAARYQQMYADKVDQLQGNSAEETRVLPNSHFESHGLDATVIEGIKRQLLATGRVRAAYLVRRRLKRQPDKASYLLGYISTPFFRLASERKLQVLTQEIAQTINLEGAFVICLEGDNKHFRSPLKRVASSRII